MKTFACFVCSAMIGCFALFMASVPAAASDTGRREEGPFYSRWPQPRLCRARVLRGLCPIGQVPQRKCPRRAGHGLQGLAQDPAAFEGVAEIVMACDGGGGHLAIPHLKELGTLMKKGVGLACIHYAVELPKGKPGDCFKDWIGGYFEQFWSVNPFYKANSPSCQAIRWPTA